MRKLTFVLAAMAAFLFAGGLAWNAHASVTGGSGNLALTAKNFTPMIKAGCGGPGPHCRWGRHWSCGPMGRCWCAPC